MQPFGARVIKWQERPFAFRQVQMLPAEGEIALEEDVLYIGEPKAVRHLPKTLLHDHFFVVRGSPDDEEPVRPGSNAIVYDEQHSVCSVINHLLILFERLRTLESQIHMAARSPQGLESLMDVGRRMIPDATIVVVDSAYNIIGATREHGSGNEYVDKLLEQGYYDKDSLQLMSEAGYFQVSDRFQHPVLSLPPNVCNDPVILRSYVANGMFYSFAGCYLPGRRPTLTDEELFLCFTEQLDNFFRETGFYSQSIPHRQQMIHDLLKYGDENPELVHDRARGLRLPENGSFRLGCIEFDEHATVAKAGYAVLQLRALNNLSNYGVMQYKNSVLIFFQDWHDYPVSEQLLFRERWAEMLSFLSKNNACIGVSLLFTNLGRLRVGYEQARTAIEIGRKIDPGAIEYHYSKYYLNDMLDRYRSKFTLDDVIVHYLDRLDGERGYNNSNLLLLYHYLNTERNISLTAKRVYMHRNSVIYRLQRIQDKLGLDLDDPDVRLRLMITFKILRMEGKLPAVTDEPSETNNAGAEHLTLVE
jgi:hypothetical protein